MKKAEIGINRVYTSTVGGAPAPEGRLGMRGTASDIHWVEQRRRFKDGASSMW